MTQPGATKRPKTPAGKALVEWAMNAAPNQLDVWRDHAVLIEEQAYQLGIRMAQPDLDEATRIAALDQ